MLRGVSGSPVHSPLAASRLDACPSLLCRSLSRNKKWACCGHPLLKVNEGVQQQNQQPGTPPAPSTAAMQHVQGSSIFPGYQHMVFAYSSPALNQRLGGMFDRLTAHMEMGIATAMQALWNVFGFFQGLLYAMVPKPADEVSALYTMTGSENSGAKQQQHHHHHHHHHRRPTKKGIPLAHESHEQQQRQPSTLLPLAHMHSVPGAGSTLQQRTSTLLRGVQQPLPHSVMSSLNPLHCWAGAALVLLAAIGSLVVVQRSRRHAAEAEAERQRQANALSLKLQKQRLRAALAFDAVHLDLPGIKESDVNPSELVDKVAGRAHAYPGELEGAIRKEWLRFMSASKVGLVTDLWDAKSTASEGPAASRAQLEEMTRRVREANNTTGSPRYSRRPKGDNDAGQGANVDDDWFLTKEDAVGAEQQASGSGAHRTRKEAQEMQIDMESMEERAARRRARLADQFASDEEVASMWKERGGSAPSRGGAQAAVWGRRGGSTGSSPSRHVQPRAARGPRSHVPRAQVLSKGPLSFAPPAQQAGEGTAAVELPATSAESGVGPQVKRLLRAQPLPPGTLPDSVFGAAVPPWQLPPQQGQAGGALCSSPGVESSSTSAEAVDWQPELESRRGGEAPIQASASSSGHCVDGAAAGGQLRQHLEQDAVLFVASPEHTTPLVATRSSSSGARTQGDPGAADAPCATPHTTLHVLTAAPLPQAPDLNPGASLDQPLIIPASGSEAVADQCEEGMCSTMMSSGSSESSDSRCSSRGAAVDAEAQLARFMRRPVPRMEG